MDNQAGTLRDLRAQLETAKELHGRRSSQALAAFQTLMTRSYELGQPLDGLRRHTIDETERFFAFTIPGPDGHVYWDGPKIFKRNDRTTRLPIRWWWEHRNGPLKPRESVQAICGERNCINPEHSIVLDPAVQTRIYSDERMIGALQVATLRLGRTPTVAEWKAAGYQPSKEAIQHRFGGWGKALIAAGLETKERGAPTSATECLSALRAARRLTGHWPTWDEFRLPRIRLHLRELGLPTSTYVMRRYLGSWPEALRKAGKR